MFVVRCAHHLRRDVDPITVFQFRLHADHAQDPRRTETGARRFHHAVRFVLVPLGCNGHDRLRPNPRVDERLSAAGLYARRDGAFRKPTHRLHRHRHVARHDHVVQRLVRHLAEPAEALNIDNAYPDLPQPQEDASARPRACSRASTRCSRSRCCSPWSRRRTGREKQRLAISIGGRRATGRSFIDARERRF